MDLKPKLEDYTEPEFLHFVKKIWAVDVPEDEHDQLVMHFDKVSQHPDGADLLFYSGDYGNYSSPEGAVIEAVSRSQGLAWLQAGTVKQQTRRSRW
jgi:hypothetical protein